MCLSPTCGFCFFSCCGFGFGHFFCSDFNIAQPTYLGSLRVSWLGLKCDWRKATLSRTTYAHTWVNTGRCILPTPHSSSSIRCTYHIQYIHTYTSIQPQRKDFPLLQCDLSKPDTTCGNVSEHNGGQPTREMNDGRVAFFSHDEANCPRFRKWMVTRRITLHDSDWF